MLRPRSRRPPTPPSRRAPTSGCAGSPHLRLEPLDVELLLIALAPDLDARFERLYGYLHDDVTRRRASIGLALDARRHSCRGRAGARARLTRGAPLVDGGLVAGRGARAAVPQALAARPGPGHRAPARRRRRWTRSLAELLAPSRSRRASTPRRLARAIAAGARLTTCANDAAASGRALAAAALPELGEDDVVGRPRPAVAARIGATLRRNRGREARLRDAGARRRPDRRAGGDGTAAVRALAEADWPGRPRRRDEPGTRHGRDQCRSLVERARTPRRADRDVAREPRRRRGRVD